MEEWVANFISELLLILGAIWIGIGFGSSQPVNGLIPVMGMSSVFISVLIKLRYPR
jgi:hypothetical protein|tara:strand:- start:128 stop:295 length:168 start_codon:yes stop_codon:yes gene_type:complete